mgnify:CR=1 FL=1
MTVRVKEDIISRFFELGVVAQDGQLEIKPLILNKKEFIQPTATGKAQFPLLTFTYCSIPFIYQIDGQEGIDIVEQDKISMHIDGYSLSHAQSERVFNRDKNIYKILVHFKNADCFNS